MIAALVLESVELSVALMAVVSANWPLAAMSRLVLLLYCHISAHMLDNFLTKRLRGYKR